MKVHKYVIKLNDEERDSLCRLVRSGDTKRRIADRARIILWANDKVTIDNSARRLDVHRETVLYWRERFLERRLDGIPECLQDLPRSGRPPVFSPSGSSGGQGGRL
jgi:transposase-like protein